MRTLLLLPLFVFAFLYAAAQSTTGSIKGTVTGQDQNPLEGVTIKLKKNSKEVVSGKDGGFIITDVAVGDYVVVIKYLGYITQQINAKVEAGKITAMETIQLKTDSKTLAEIQINGGNNKFLDKKTDYVARLPLTDLENPQVYHSVTKELLQEQMVVNYQEALRNAPGVTTAVYPAGGFAANLRGFLTGVNHRNGMASLTNTKSLDPINIERLEVIKGPSATLFGSSSISFGGLINEVTKRPFAKPQTEISYATGTQGLNRLTADVNTPVNSDKTALLRINTAFHQEKSFQVYGHKTTFVLAPSFAYQVNDKLSFVIDAELFFADRTQTIFPTFSAGTTFKNLKNQPIAYKMSLGGDDMDSRAFSSQIVAEAKYKLSPQVTSVSNLAYISNQDRSNQIYVTWQTDDRVIRRISNSGPRTNTNLKLQQNFIIDHKIGQMRNRLVAGLDVYKVSSKQQNYAQFAYDTVSVSKPFVAVTANKINALLGKLNPTFNESFQDTYSAYFSDVIDLTSRLNAMVSLRIDRYENKPSRANGIPAAIGSFKQTALSPKFGLVYQLVKDQLSLFGNYMNGFSNVAPFTQPDGNISIFKPLQANQYEFGLKTEAFDHRLNVTASYYNIDLTNATRRTDEGFTVQDGTQKSKGFEIEVITNPVKGLNLSAGYAYNDSYYTKAIATLLDKKVQATPRDIVNVWASYRFSDALFKNIGLGIGGNYVSNSYFDTANTFIIPYYTVVNATLFYDQPKWRFGVKANNITDTRYWDRYATSQVTRQWIANVAFKF
jgi:iron complex outermembrane receptor protein